MRASLPHNVTLPIVMPSLRDARSIGRSWLALAVLVSILIGLAASVSGSTVVSQPPQLIAAVLLSLGLGTVAIIRFRAARDLLDPLGLVVSSALFYFGLHAIWLFDNPPWGISPPSEDAYVRAAALIALGVLALVGAYSWWRPRPWVSRADGREIPVAALVFLFGFGIAARLYGAQLGVWQTYAPAGDTQNQQLVTTISLFSTVAFVVAACQYYRSLTGGHIVLLMGIAQVAFAIAVGRKELVLEVVLAWVAARHYCYKPISLRLALTTLAVFVLFFTPLIQSGRSERALGGLAATEQTQSTVSTLPGRFGELITHPDRALEGWDIIQRRTVGIEGPTLAVDVTPESRPFEHGRTFVTIPFAVIPRFVWPDKPFYDATVEFSQNYARVPRGGGVAVSPTIPGDLYLNFGVAGVIVGFAIIGFILKWLSAWLRSGDIVIAVTLYTLLMARLVQLELSVSALGGFLLINGLLTVLVLQLLRRLGTPTDFRGVARRSDGASSRSPTTLASP